VTAQAKAATQSKRAIEVASAVVGIPATAAPDTLDAFLARADAAAKAAKYDGELLYDELLGASRAVVRAWQKFLVKLDAEFAELDEPAA
jgi:hypothetical protein